MTETKQQWRQKGLALRHEMSEEERELQSSQIFDALISSSLYQQADCILTYLSTPTEPSTMQIVASALQSGKPVSAPIVNGKNIEFYLLEDLQQLTSGYRGILEPLGRNKPSITSSTLCIVPGLWFDRQGYRIGYGGGYYDRFLSEFSGISLGLCFTDFLLDKENLPYEILDIPAQFICHPKVGIAKV